MQADESPLTGKMAAATQFQLGAGGQAIELNPGIASKHGEFDVRNRPDGGAAPALWWMFGATRLTMRRFRSYCPSTYTFGRAPICMGTATIFKLLRAN